MAARPVLLLAAALIGSPVVFAAERSKGDPTGLTSIHWTFDTDRIGEAPADFSFAKTGEGRVGRWIVQAERDAPSEAFYNLLLR